MSTNESLSPRGRNQSSGSGAPRLPLIGRFFRRTGRQAEAEILPLHHPVMIVAFEGWNDAGEAASYAASFLERAWSAMPFAEIDPEEFFDFTEVRPEVQLNPDQTRTIKWPVTSFSLATAGGQGNDVILVSGSEPQLRWRTYCEAFIELAKSLSIERVIMLGAYLGEITHSRPVPISASTHDSTLVDSHGLAPSHYEGPTGILGVLGAALSEVKIPSVSVWASVPCYSLPIAPKAALALTRVATTLAERFVDMAELEVEATDYEMRMNELLSEDENVAAYVERIQEFEAAETEVLSTDGLAEEIERYLHGGEES
ncbi:MAG TPA: PAC2 family protein [Acidimicrobiales bacterium]|nr:PAC2 family protein [Acidimicrobiales bacterium]